MTDPITDMFNRIWNAQLVLNPTVEMPFSNMKASIFGILKKEGFISDFKKRGKKPHQIIKVQLKYNEDKSPAMSGFKRISKPGQRVYKKSKEIKTVKGGYKVAILSTNKGLMINKEARKNKLGGEVICEIW